MKPKPFETYQNRVVQFEKSEKQPITKATKKKVIEAMDNTNPYLKARLIILTERYSDFKRKEIAEMERTGNIHNHHYDAFVHEVAILGDTL